MTGLLVNLIGALNSPSRQSATLSEIPLHTTHCLQKQFCLQFRWWQVVESITCAKAAFIAGKGYRGKIAKTHLCSRSGSCNETRMPWNKFHSCCLLLQEHIQENPSFPLKPSVPWSQWNMLRWKWPNDVSLSFSSVPFCMRLQKEPHRFTSACDWKYAPVLCKMVKPCYVNSHIAVCLGGNLVYRTPNPLRFLDVRVPSRPTWSDTVKISMDCWIWPLQKFRNVAEEEGDLNGINFLT